ncbi:MAG: hypothetical protein CO095_05055 [Armatimonadetes bacterium CG_4_9_14_3_um_filter_58_7]|nr:MAG: hypothetical protein CO095_05055 [Armatimonadetes bacterium CG_4_9_14_3_um_filter_58_7]
MRSAFYSSSSPSLPFPHASLRPRAHAAVAPADLEALKQLFQKDPATAFEKSWEMFQAPKKNGDWVGRRG